MIQRIAGTRLGNDQLADKFQPQAVTPRIASSEVTLLDLSGGETEQVHLAVRLALAARAADVTGLWEEDCVWWMGARGGLRIPYAVTDAALAYYVAQIEAFRDGDFSATPEGTVESSQVSYRAVVEHHDLFVHDGRRFQNADVVRLELSWSHFCAGPCAFGFTLIRHVIFVPDEDPVAMNDGSPAVW